MIFGTIEENSRTLHGLSDTDIIMILDALEFKRQQSIRAGCPVIAKTTRELSINIEECLVNPLTRDEIDV